MAIEMLINEQSAIRLIFFFMLPSVDLGTDRRILLSVWIRSKKREYGTNEKKRNKRKFSRNFRLFRLFRLFRILSLFLRSEIAFPRANSQFRLFRYAYFDPAKFSVIHFGCLIVTDEILRL